MDGDVADGVGEGAGEAPDLLTPVAEVRDGTATAKLWQNADGSRRATAVLRVGRRSTVLKTLVPWPYAGSRGALLFWLREEKERIEGRRPKR